MYHKYLSAVFFMVDERIFIQHNNNSSNNKMPPDILNPSIMLLLCEIFIDNIIFTCMRDILSLNFSPQT